MNSENTNPAVASSPSNNETGVNQGDDAKTFSQDEVNQIVRKRVNEINAKSEASITEALEKAKIEWERQAKLTEEERLSEARKAKDSELAEKERSITLRENRADAIEKLAELNIDTKLVDFVVDTNHDKMLDNIERLNKAYNEAVSKAVEKKLAGKTPTDYGDGNKTTDNDETLTSRGYRKSGMTAF